MDETWQNEIETIAYAAEKWADLETLEVSILVAFREDRVCLADSCLWVRRLASSNTSQEAVLTLRNTYATGYRFVYKLSTRTFVAKSYHAGIQVVTYDHPHRVFPIDV
jgi:hypothetical protein